MEGNNKNLPAKGTVNLPGKNKKISSMSKEAAEFISKMDKKKKSPVDIASALESWLDNS
jgi:hypothetical protein